MAERRAKAFVAFVSRGGAGALGLAVWFAIMLIVGAGLLSRHLVALPAPAKTAKLAASRAELRRPATQGAWLAVHVLYSECRCSQRVVDHLLSSARPTDWAEVVLWVGQKEPDALLARRFDGANHPSGASRSAVTKRPIES